MAKKGKRESQQFWSKHPFTYNLDPTSEDFFVVTDRKVYKWGFFLCEDGRYEYRDGKYIARFDSWEPLAEPPPLSKFIDFGSLLQKKILEVGVGVGVLFSYLCKYGKGYGIDIGPGAVSLTAQRLKKFKLDGNTCTADAENLPFKSSEFDAVVSYGVLHHTPDTQKAINEVWRCLKPGGVAYVMLYHKFSTYVFRTVVTDLLFRGKLYDGTFTSDTIDPEGKGAPVAKAYTRREVKKMFENFSNISIQVDGHPNMILSPLKIPLWLADRLRKRIGFLLLIKAYK